MYNSNELYKYKVIRAKKEYVNTMITKLENVNYIKIDALYNVPNASTLWLSKIKSKILFLTALT